MFRFLVPNNDWDWQFFAKGECPGAPCWTLGRLGEWSVPHQARRFYPVWFVTEECLRWTHEDLIPVMLREILLKVTDRKAVLMSGSTSIPKFY